MGKNKENSKNKKNKENKIKPKVKSFLKIVLIG